MPEAEFALACLPESSAASARVTPPSFADQ